MIAKRLLVGIVALGAVAFLGIAADGIQWVRAQPRAPTTVPHGTFSSQTDLCDDCHLLHATSVGRNATPAYPWEGLLRQQSQSELCYRCHDGSGADTNTQREFTAEGVRSSHPIVEARDGVVLACSDCHAVHHDPDGDVKLLYRETEPGTYVFSTADEPIGDSFCYGCHGARSTLPAPFGDKHAFETSIHATAEGVEPATEGTDLQCSACHEPHASRFRYLTRASQEDLCFTCHASEEPNTANDSDPAAAFTARENDYTTSDGNGIRIFHHPVAADDQDGGARRVECASCHNAHAVTQMETATDPARARQMDAGWRFSWDRASGLYNRSPNAAAYCGTCHVSADTVSPLSASKRVPYDISLVSDLASDPDGTVHDAFDLTRYLTGASSAHGNPSYEATTYPGCPPGEPCELACTACHDFHGSSNAYMLRENIVSPDYRPVPILGATWTPASAGSGGTVELEIGRHGIAPGWVVTVSGVTPSAYDGTWTVTDVTATTVSYAARGNPGRFVRAGTLETGGPEGRPSAATITGFGGLDTAADRARLQTFCLTCHLEQSSSHNAGSLCTSCHDHSSTSDQPF